MLLLYVQRLYRRRRDVWQPPGTAVHGIHSNEHGATPLMGLRTTERQYAVHSTHKTTTRTRTHTTNTHLSPMSLANKISSLPPSPAAAASVCLLLQLRVEGGCPRCCSNRRMLAT